MQSFPSVNFTQIFLSLLVYSCAGHIVCEAPTNENRKTLISELGELILEFSKAGRRFIKKLFLAKDPEKVVVEEILDLMREVANTQVDRLQSAVRGGARTTLALMLAHYRTAKPARLWIPFDGDRGGKRSAFHRSFGLCNSHCRNGEGGDALRGRPLPGDPGELLRRGEHR